MNLFNRLKDLIVGDLMDTDTQKTKPTTTAETTPEPAAKAQPAPKPEPEPVAEPKPEPVAESKPEPVAEAKPEPVAESKPEPAPKAAENYVENKYDALNMVCGHLAKYAYSTDKRLGRLSLVVVTHNDDDHVDWADSSFVRELQSRLQQEMITAVQQIDVLTVTPDELADTLARDNRLSPISQGRIYFKTQPIDERVITNTPPARLECVGGEQYVANTTYDLKPDEQTSWNIGRSPKPTPFEVNHIVINDDCLDVSRRQAAIVIDDGQYYLDGREGGVRMRGGRLTRIIRANGRTDDIISVAHRSLAPLANGDIIQISKTVYLKFYI